MPLGRRRLVVERIPELSEEVELLLLGEVTNGVGSLRSRHSRSLARSKSTEILWHHELMMQLTPRNTNALLRGLRERNAIGGGKASARREHAEVADVPSTPVPKRTSGL